MIPLFESVVSFTDLKAFLAIAIKHRRLMVLCVCFGLASALTYITYARPVYYSKALIDVIASEPLPVDAQTVFIDSTLPSVIAQLKSPHIAERTARALGLKGGLDTLVKKTVLTVNSERDLTLEIWPYSAVVARRWPAAVVNEFLDYREERRFERREKKVKDFTGQLEKIRIKIEETEEEKKRFIEAEGVEATRRLLSEMTRVPGRLALVNEKLAYLQPLKDKLRDRSLSTIELLSLLTAARRHGEQLEVGKILQAGDRGTNASSTIIVTPDGAAEETWQRLEKEQRRLKQDLKEAETVYLPGHRKIVELTQALEKVDKELAFELDTAAGRFALEFTALDSEKDDLKKQLVRFDEIREKDAELARKFQQLQAGRLGWESMYSTLARSLEQLEFADHERVTIQFMGLTDYKPYPISPYRKKILLFGLLFGLGLAIGVPFVLEYLDDTIAFDEQVERQLGLQNIGIIPEIEKKPREETELDMLAEKHGRMFKEYFRVIRVNLMSNVKFTGPRQVFMIASALPKEGKSIVSLNLALSFASLGEKTLLIDADLRRGALHRIFETSPRPGLGQLLRSESSFREAILSTSQANLFFLPCGRHVSSASELLETGAFSNLMKDLRGQYQRIVLDTPPILGLAETSSMARLADGILLVIWSGGTPLKAIRTAKAMLDANGAKFFGTVLNKMNMSSATTYYYYYYYSYKYYQAYQTHDETPATGIESE
ncbi:MAG: polysaccharide biosynthesis tyrosine autokinase [Lentisphaerae bacterium]|nr:polysaccharide biosynthesis tyrosine autokinase [Lentisphaerota bacterium]